MRTVDYCYTGLTNGPPASGGRILLLRNGAGPRTNTSKKDEDE